MLFSSTFSSFLSGSLLFTSLFSAINFSILSLAFFHENTTCFVNVYEYDFVVSCCIQNACARLVCNTSTFCHITPLLKNLHWLPIRQRIAFKILLIVYKALNGQAPCYISELLAWKANTYSHNLRSSKDTLLLKPPTQLTKITLGDRAFICAAPKLWNSLPVSVRKAESLLSFKTL